METEIEEQHQSIMEEHKTQMKCVYDLHQLNNVINDKKTRIRSYEEKREVCI